jgi:hypothetical protein
MTSEQRPPVYSGHFFGVPRVVVVHKFDCIVKHFANVKKLRLKELILSLIDFILHDAINPIFTTWSSNPIFCFIKKGYDNDDKEVLMHLVKMPVGIKIINTFIFSS